MDGRSGKATRSFDIFAAHGKPETPQQRGNADKWMDWAANTLSPPMKDCFWQMVRFPALSPEKCNADILAKGIAEGTAAWALFSANIKGKFLLGDEFSMADVAIGPFVYRWFAMPIPDRNDPPVLKAYHENLKTLPGFLKHVAQPLS